MQAGSSNVEIPDDDEEAEPTDDEYNLVDQYVKVFEEMNGTADNASKKYSYTKEDIGDKSFSNIYIDADPVIMPASSVQKKFTTLWIAWFEYCANLTESHEVCSNNFGLNLFKCCANMFTPSSSPDHNNYMKSMIEGFIDHLITNDYSKSVINNASTFLNAHLRCEFYCRMKLSGHHSPQAPNFSVGSDGTIKSRKVIHGKQLQRKMQEEMDDLHSQIDPKITEEQTHTMLMSVFYPSKNGKMSKLCDTNKINFGCSYTNSAHYNSLRDVTAWYGLLWILRFFIQRESLPDFLDYRQLYHIPTFRGKRGGKIDADQFRKNWSAPFHDAQVTVGRLTHQFRRQLYWFLSNLKIDLSRVQKFFGHKVESLSTSCQVNYLTNPPVECIVACAGGDVDLPMKSHQPPWCMSDVDDSMLRLFPCFDNLLNQRDKVKAEYDKCNSHAERKEKRLYTSLGCVEVMILDVKRCFQFLASRPVDPEKNIINQNQPIYFDILKKSNTMKNLWNHSVFQSPQFNYLTKCIRCLEDEWLGISLSIPRPITNELQRNFNEYVAPLVRSMASMQMLLSQLQTRLEEDRAASIANIDALEKRNQTRYEHLLLLLSNSSSTSNIPELDIQDNSSPIVVAPSPKEVITCDDERFELDDNGCRSAKDYYSLYKECTERDKVKGIGWRNDQPGKDGKKKNSKAQWYSTRRPIFDFFRNQEEEGVTKEEAIDKAQLIFDRCPRLNKGDKTKPKLKELSKLFDKENGGRKRGRRKGTKNAGPLAKKQKNDTLFDQAFPNMPYEKAVEICQLGDKVIRENETCEEKAGSYHFGNQYVYIPYGSIPPTMTDLYQANNVQPQNRRSFSK